MANAQQIPLAASTFSTLVFLSHSQSASPVGKFSQAFFPVGKSSLELFPVGGCPMLQLDETHFKHEGEKTHVQISKLLSSPEKHLLT